jgi:hypothetical protein
LGIGLKLIIVKDLTVDVAVQLDYKRFAQLSVP